MLGEKHSLLNDFPSLKNTIEVLLKNDASFAEENKRYNALDKEIRELELQDDPISDEAMHQLKHNRAVLKDDLYQKVIAAKNE